MPRVILLAGILALLAARVCQILDIAHQIAMVGPEQVLPDAQDFLKESLRLGILASLVMHMPEAPETNCEKRRFVRERPLGYGELG